MKKSNSNHLTDLKPDLKHDTMEYSASTEGDDILDMDNETQDEIEDEEISAEELELLEGEDVDAQAAALNSAETDRLADNDVHFEVQVDDFERDDNDEKEFERE